MTCCAAPPGPKGRPLLGHALSLAQGKLAFLRACAGEFGDLVSLRFFWKRVLFVNHPDHVACVLATNHRKVVKGVAHRTDYALIGDGLALCEGEVWRRERRLMQPAFHRERIAAYGEVMVALTERRLEAWRDGETRDVCADMSELALAIVAKTLFGMNGGGGATELPEALTSALDCRNARVRSLELLVPDRLPTPLNLRMRRARRRVDDVVYRIIAERRAAGADHGDLLSLLLGVQDEDGRRLTDHQVRDEVLTILVGGTETVADLLSWIWYLLSQHPEVEARLLDELETALGDRSPTVSDLPRLPYAGMIVSEALRLYPPAPVLEREAITDFNIGAYRVGRGTEIVMSPWVMHRNPHYFVDPEAFDPDRWADDLANRIPRYAYFPFGGGPRLCIGKSFATMEVILVLASIARCYRLQLLPGHRVVAEEVPALRPKLGLPMIVHPRPGHPVPHRPLTSSERAER